ncbi:MAG: heavy-metal-associated domain-containing protein [Alphaproteobacteria bacterium]
MKKLLLTLTFTILLTPSAFAGEIVTINVNGMVCDFCAQAIEKVFMKQDAVESIKVDLTTKQITATLKDNQNIDDETITKLVTDSGYAIESIERKNGEKDE